MKVLLINGSPHQYGCTYTALNEVAKELECSGIETEILHIGTRPIGGCIACGVCRKIGKCVFPEGGVNEALAKAKEADGIVFGSPVYYASGNGSMIGFMDRLFYAGASAMAYKPGACIASARRAGTTATLDQMNKYLTINNMPLVSSQYWNMVHGNTPEEVKQDQEGLQVMRTLGRNMAWLLKSIEAGRQAGISLPQAEPRERTNFIR